MQWLSDRLLSSCGGDARRLSFLTLSETASCEFVFNPIKLIPMMSSSMRRLDLRVVATTTVVTARNINTASVDLSSVYTAAGAPINSFITAGISFFASPWS
ncbi:hypothetical protein YC2023_049847 [Brassica napus]